MTLPQAESPAPTVVPLRAAPPDREVELKFAFEAADEAAVRRAFRTLGARPRVKHLRAVYFDTDDHALRDAGFALRIRDEGDRRVQTIKADDGQGLFDRSEWETPVEGILPDLDHAASTPLKAVLDRCGPLKPAFSTDVERRVLKVHRDGTEVEAALDIGAIEAVGRRTPVLQLELELKAGSPEVLFAIARELSEAAPLTLTFETKNEIGYRTLEGAAPEALVGVKSRIARGMSAEAAFAAAAGACLKQIVHNAAVAKGYRRPEAVHQTRVGLRRLRTAMKLFAPMLGDTAAIDGELKWMAGELDLARDTDVFMMETFGPAARAYPGTPGMADFGKRLLQAQTRAYDALCETMASPRGRDLGLTLARWIEAGDWRTSETPAAAEGRAAPVESLADAALGKLARQIRKRGRNIDTLPDEARHKVRIRGKRLRYGLEFFGPLYSRKAVAAYAEELKAFQDVLGSLNDMTVGLDAAARYLREGDGADMGFATGLVVGRRMGEAAPLLKQAARRHKALRKGRRPWEDD